MSLPLIGGFTAQTFSQLQTLWKGQIDPVLSNLLVQGVLLPNISLINGVNTVSHRLNRLQRGWMLADLNASVTIFRSLPFTTTTLTLTSNGACTVSLWVF